jgi:hypothetical protein
MAALKLIPSPRLYVPDDLAENLEHRLHSPFFQTTAQRVIRDADSLTRKAALREGEAPAYGEAARWVQSHLECLTCAWILTRRIRYRRAAMRHLAGLLKWNHISCEARANTPVRVELPFAFLTASSRRRSV